MTRPIILTLILASITTFNVTTAFITPFERSFNSLRIPVPSSDNIALSAVKKTAKKSVASPEVFRKPEFVTSISEKTGLSKTDASAALDAVLSTITEQVSDGKKITFLNFGSFMLKHRAARMGRNPQTGEEIEIKARSTPSFSASQSFKDLCNE